MKIYKLRCGKGFQWLLPEKESDNDLLRFGGMPLASSWKPIRMRHISRLDNRGPILRERGDFPGGAGVVISNKAKREIGPLLERYGELLPLIAEDDELYWVLNVTRFVDALDVGMSDVLYATGDREKILMVNKYAFKPDALVGEQIFKINQLPRGQVYFTDECVTSICSGKLRGMDFYSIWQLVSN